MKISLPFVAIAMVVLCLPSCRKSESVASTESVKPKLKALIIDGQNNHGKWVKTTVMMKDYLEQTGLFTVDVARTAVVWVGPHNNADPGFGDKARQELLQQYPIEGLPEATVVPDPIPDPNFSPDFSRYDVVVSNFGWKAANWADDTKKAFEAYVKNGGGFVLVHAADNSFGEWPEFNRMIGMGAWGDRDEKTGPYVYINTAGETVRDTTAGPAGSHGKQYSFEIDIKDAGHPITQGMPTKWMHAQDELYDRLRGPAEQMSILATSYSDKDKNDSPFSDLTGTNRNEPMMMTIDYGKGRVFHTPLGHADYSMECVGFITLLQRGTEWAASGRVSIPIPADFPTADSIKIRKWNR